MKLTYIWFIKHSNYHLRNDHTFYVVEYISREVYLCLVQHQSCCSGKDYTSCSQSFSSLHIFFPPLFLSQRSCHPMLLLTGPPGCGKTATLHALAKDMAFSIVEWVNPNTDAILPRDTGLLLSVAIDRISVQYM